MKMATLSLMGKDLKDLEVLKLITSCWRDEEVIPAVYNGENYKFHNGGDLPTLMSSDVTLPDISVSDLPDEAEITFVNVELVWNERFKRFFIQKA